MSRRTLGSTRRGRGCLDYHGARGLVELAGVVGGSGGCCDLISVDPNGGGNRNCLGDNLNSGRPNNFALLMKVLVLMLVSMGLGGNNGDQNGRCCDDRGPHYGEKFLLSVSEGMVSKSEQISWRRKCLRMNRSAGDVSVSERNGVEMGVDDLRSKRLLVFWSKECNRQSHSVKRAWKRESG